MFSAQLKNRLSEIGKLEILSKPEESNVELITLRCLVLFLVEIGKEIGTDDLKSLKHTWNGQRKKAEQDGSLWGWDLGSLEICFMFRLKRKKAALTFRAEIEIGDRLVEKSLKAEWA